MPPPPPERGPAGIGVRRRCRPLRRLLLLALVAGATPSAAAHAQGATAEQRLRQQQDELNKLRRERADLERRMTELQRSARTLAEEVQNLEAQRTTTARLLAALDRQLAAIATEVATAGRELARAEQELAAKRATVKRRVVEIYKRGALHDAEVLLSAQSFGALVARYKYLRELTRYDRMLVARVEALRNEIASQRELLVRLQDEVATNRAEKAREAARLAQLEAQRQRSLTTVRRTAEQTRARLTQIARDESRVAGIIATLETARRRAEMAPDARPAAPSTIRTSDLGKLDWPVDGSILYNFGRVVNQNNTTTRWNGIGIEAPAGTPVRAIAAGEVVHASAVGTYGLTVIVQHGGGDYTLYASLQRASVSLGQQVQKGQAIGTVGAADPDMPPHLHLEIRPRGRAVDPLEWLRGRR
jgi:septal ring factor EnvC (AmiA/AmiB activator)